MRGLAALLLAGFTTLASAQIPSQLRLQGRLEDGGVAVAGSVDLVLALYDVSSGGSPIMTEADPGVVASADGSFVTTFGDTVSLPVEEFSKELWVGVSIDGGSELPERIPLTPAPHALVAQRIERGPGQTFYLSHDGDDASSGAALVALVDEVRTNVSGPRVIRVGPGRYETSTFLNLFADMAVVGAGPGATVIDSTSALVIDAAGDRVRVANLSVNGVRKGIDLLGDDARVENVFVNLIVTDSGPARGIGLLGGADQSLRESEVQITATAGTATVEGIAGVGSTAGPVTLTRCRVDLVGGGVSFEALDFSGGAGHVLQLDASDFDSDNSLPTATAIGVQLSGAGTIELHHGEVRVNNGGGGGTVLSLNQASTGTIRVAHSLIEGATSGAPGVCGVHNLGADYKVSGVPACP